MVPARDRLDAGGGARRRAPFKRPADLASAVRGFDGYDRRRYVLLCLACAVLERADPQITLRLLGEKLLQLAAEPEPRRPRLYVRAHLSARAARGGVRVQDLAGPRRAGARRRRGGSLRAVGLRAG